MTTLPKLHNCKRHPYHPALDGQCMGCWAETNAQIDAPKAQPPGRPVVKYDSTPPPKEEE